MNKIRKIGILLHSEVSVSAAFLIKDIFRRTKQRTPDSSLRVEFVILENFMSLEDPLQWTRSPRNYVPDLLIVPPMGSFSGDLKHSISKLHREINYIKRLDRKGNFIASSCLGAFLLAEAGILNGKKATTHWGYSEFAQKNFPEVQWKMQKIIESDENVITSGGYLTMVDLSFLLIERFIGRKISTEMAKRLLADSIRESQSLYILRQDSQKNQTPFQRKAQMWFENNHKNRIELQFMAKDLGMSERTLHRQFQKEYALAPNQWIQHQRVEKAQLLLEKTDLSQEEIVADLGLSDINSFRRIFVRETGLTPAAFRKKIRKSKI